MVLKIHVGHKMRIRCLPRPGLTNSRTAAALYAYSGLTDLNISITTPNDDDTKEKTALALLRGILGQSSYIRRLKISLLNSTDEDTS